jgi:putative heme iron utilization protein
VQRGSPPQNFLSSSQVYSLSITLVGTRKKTHIHVSQLAAHTKDMLEHPRVSLLVIAPPAPGVMAQELARITVQGAALRVAAGTPEQAAYLARFPQSEPMFGFADFSLFAIVPESIRFVGGFAQATTISRETLADVLSEA